jgi:hypothetical protein
MIPCPWDRREEYLELPTSMRSVPRWGAWSQWNTIITRSVKLSFVPKITLSFVRATGVIFVIAPCEFIEYSLFCF